jgi:hypothetical protein
MIAMSAVTLPMGFHRQKITLRSGDTLTNDRIERWCYC